MKKKKKRERVTVPDSDEFKVPVQAVEKDLQNSHKEGKNSSGMRFDKQGVNFATT